MVDYSRERVSYTERPFLMGSRGMKTVANVSNGVSEGLAEK